jgi:hypothetical protein
VVEHTLGESLVVLFVTSNLFSFIRNQEWHVEQSGQHQHFGLRALHAATFEIDAIVAANEARTDRQLTSTSRDAIEAAQLDARSACQNIDFAREKFQRDWFNTILPTSNIFAGKLLDWLFVAIDVSPCLLTVLVSGEFVER